MKKRESCAFRILAVVLMLSLMLPMFAFATEANEELVETPELVEGADTVEDVEEVEEPAEEVEEEVEEPAEEVTEEVEEVEEEVVVKTATSTASKVLVNGVEVSFEAYLIDGFNYFKLRDLAEVAKGTEKQFEVEWDGELNLIKLTTGKEYTTAGGELTEGDGLDKEAKLNKSKILIDDVEVELEAYTIDGLNYFKLRDVAKAFDVGVTYDEETSTIVVDTTTGYIE